MVLSIETKQRIRAPWARALTVKVFGRTVGYHFLLSRVTALWKPAGKIDCIDLGKDYFLIRFSLLEDHDSVLKKGPWFIGDHFLAIHPWKPNFCPASVSLSSVAVWVRLPQLPIEYYDTLVLKDIGKAIGPVLRIDTHTASKARGRYARMCVQVDVSKPLISTIVIEGLHQPVIYEVS